MDRRVLPLLLFLAAASGCATLGPEDDLPPSSTVDVLRATPAQDYDAGVLYLARGEYELARREWNRCLAVAPPESPARLDCMVALEKLERPSSLEATQ